MAITLELSEYYGSQLRDLAAERDQSIQDYLLCLIDEALLRRRKSSLDVGSVKIEVTTEEIVEFIHDGRGNDRW